MLITAYTYQGTNNPLQHTEAEAFEVQTAYGGESVAEVRIDEPVSALDTLLEGRKIWWFCGHGDMPLAGNEVPAFGCSAFDIVSLPTLLNVVARHVAKGNLKLIVLTGCKTEEFGRRLRAWTFVECVVCWATKLNDQAGRIFGKAFAGAWQRSAAEGRTISSQDAFQQACNAVETYTDRRPLYQGGRLRTMINVQVFKLEDPDSPKLSHGFMPGGVPKLLHDERDATLVLFLRIEGHILRETGGPAGDERSLPVLTRVTELDLINSTLDETLEVDISSAEVWRRHRCGLEPTAPTAPVS